MNPKESVNTTPSLFSLCSNSATVSFPLVAASVNTAVLRMGEGHSQLCLAPLKWKPTGSLWEAWQRRHVKHSHHRTQSRGPVHLTGVRDHTCHARAACGAVRLRDSWSVKGEDQILPERSRSTGSHCEPWALATSQRTNAFAHETLWSHSTSALAFSSLNAHA